MDFRKIPFARLLEADKIDGYLGLGRSWYSTNSTSLQAAAERHHRLAHLRDVAIATLTRC